MNVWWNKGWVRKSKVGGRGREKTDEAEDDCYDCCGRGVAAGFGHDGWVSFSFSFLRIGLDWIGSDWIGVARRRWEEWQ